MDPGALQEPVSSHEVPKFKELVKRIHNKKIIVREAHHIVGERVSQHERLTLEFPLVFNERANSPEFPRRVRNNLRLPVIHREFHQVPHVGTGNGRRRDLAILGHGQFIGSLPNQGVPVGKKKK